MRIKDLITSRVCGNTVFEDSWIWYCDECRQHGTAITAEEAEYGAEAHILWYSALVKNGELFFDEDESCIYYYDMKLEERGMYEWDNCDACCVYIIDEKSNITYDLHDDYTDKTPNKVGDLGVMIELQKRLGVE
jgi:hypothetical protein